MFFTIYNVPNFPTMADCLSSSCQKVGHIPIIYNTFIWGISSNGRAAALHAAGKGIDALILHFFLCQFIYSHFTNDCPLDYHNSRAVSRMGD
jgi:hypothetical protein